MTCPDLGFWRAWLDHEVDDAAFDPLEHLDACADCRALVVELRRNAALAEAAIRRLAPTSLPSPTAPALGASHWDRVKNGTEPGRDEQAAPVEPALPGRPVHHIQENRSMAWTRALPFQRWRFAMSGLAAALVLMLLLGTPQGRGAAAQFLAQFRGERFAAVQLSTNQIANIEQTMSDLQHLGQISGINTAPEPQAVASVAEASQSVGFAVLEPDPATLPAGISSTPTEVRVMPAHQVRFTFDLDQARAYYQSIGRNDVTLPDRFDGASLVVNTPPAVLLQYRNSETPVDSPFGFGLLVGQAGQVTAGVEGGVTLAELREFLLGLPGLAPETVEQLRAIEDWETTLPVPIPVEHINWERTTIAGNPGLLLNDNTGLGSAAIWQRDGRIFGIAGAMKARELQRVAESLR